MDTKLAATQASTLQVNQPERRNLGPRTRTSNKQMVLILCLSSEIRENQFFKQLQGETWELHTFPPQLGIRFQPFKTVLEQ